MISHVTFCGSMSSAGRFRRSSIVVLRASACRGSSARSGRVCRLSSWLPHSQRFVRLVMSLSDAGISPVKSCCSAGTALRAWSRRSGPVSCRSASCCAGSAQSAFPRDRTLRIPSRPGLPPSARYRDTRSSSLNVTPCQSATGVPATQSRVAAQIGHRVQQGLAVVRQAVVVHDAVAIRVACPRPSPSPRCSSLASSVVRRRDRHRVARPSPRGRASSPS